MSTSNNSTSSQLSQSVFSGTTNTSALVGNIANHYSISSASSTCSITTSADSLNASIHGYLALNSSFQVCVDYYYYNSSSVISFNPQSKLSILTYYSVPDSNATRIVTANTFSVSATSGYLTDGQIQLGGPNAVNEGTEVTYTISTTSSTKSGIYFISLDALLYPQSIACESVLELVVGNEQYHSRRTVLHSRSHGAFTRLH